VRVATSDRPSGRFGFTWDELAEHPALSDFVLGIKAALSNRLDLEVTPLAEETLKGVTEDVLGYLGYLHNVLGYSRDEVAEGCPALECSSLGGFWSFNVTAKALGGRGCGRTTMRTKCNHIAHLLVGCMGRGV
jgi:hypothetical protein